MAEPSKLEKTFPELREALQRVSRREMPDVIVANLGIERLFVMDNHLFGEGEGSELFFVMKLSGVLKDEQVFENAIIVLLNAAEWIDTNPNSDINDYLVIQKMESVTKE